MVRGVSAAMAGVYQLDEGVYGKRAGEGYIERVRIEDDQPRSLEQWTELVYEVHATRQGLEYHIRETPDGEHTVRFRGSKERSRKKKPHRRGFLGVEVVRGPSVEGADIGPWGGLSYKVKREQLPVTDEVIIRVYHRLYPEVYDDIVIPVRTASH